MNLVFGMDGVICTPCKDYHDVELARPLANVKDFMTWLIKNEHHAERARFPAVSPAART